MKRKKIVFLRSTIPYTTSYYYFKALTCLDVDVVDIPFDPHEPQRNEDLPEGDLLLLVDCGLPVAFPFLENITYPKGYVSIDSCHKFEIHKKYCDENQFDFVWVAQKHMVEKMGRNAFWLPLAADEDEHVFRPELRQGEKYFRRVFKKNHYDIGMCAAPYDHRRNFEKIFREAGLSTNFHYRKMFGKHSTREIAHCTIGFNVGAGYTGERGMDLNMRVFETMANGQAMLLTNRYDGLGYEDLFENGVHYVTFSTDQEALEKATYFSHNPMEAARIARNGQRHILEKHTYVQRCEEILRFIQ